MWFLFLSICYVCFIQLLTKYSTFLLYPTLDVVVVTSIIHLFNTFFSCFILFMKNFLTLCGRSLLLTIYPSYLYFISLILSHLYLTCTYLAVSSYLSCFTSHFSVFLGETFIPSYHLICKSLYRLTCTRFVILFTLTRQFCTLSTSIHVVDLLYPVKSLIVLDNNDVIRVLYVYS